MSPSSIISSAQYVFLNQRVIEGMIGVRRLEINATLTHISNHPSKWEIHTSFLEQEPLFLRGPTADVWSGDRQSVFKAAPALYAALLTGGKLGMMERGMKGGKADL